MKNTVKYRKENLKERLEHDEGSWAKLGEQLATQTKNMYGQLGDMFRLLSQLQTRIETLEKTVTKLKNSRLK